MGLSVAGGSRLASTEAGLLCSAGLASYILRSMMTTLGERRGEYAMDIKKRRPTTTAEGLFTAGDDL